MSEIVIPLHGATRKGQEFDYELSDAFLSDFGRDVLEGLDCKVHLFVVQKGDWLEVQCAIKGNAKVQCDRCLEDLLLPVDVEETLTVRFDAAPEDVVNDDDNVIILREGTSEMDLGQTLYDLVCVSLPMCKVHPEGECNPEALARLSKEEEIAKEPVNTPFSGLKDLLKQKEN